VGIAVNVLPLCHPVRIAEKPRRSIRSARALDFGVGRSGFPRAYEGMVFPTRESERFQESLEIFSRLTEEPFSYTGKYYTFN